MTKVNYDNIPTIAIVKMMHSSGDQVANQLVDKQYFRDSSNFLYTFRPIYYVSRVFGLMPYTIVYDTNGDAVKPKKTACDCLWFVISILVYTALAYLIYQEKTVPSYDKSTSMLILMLGDRILSILSLIFGAQLIIMDMCNRYKLIDILKNVTIFDKEVSFPINAFNSNKFVFLI